MYGETETMKLDKEIMTLIKQITKLKAARDKREGKHVFYR